MEEAKLPDAEFLFLRIHSNEKTLAIIPCFTYRLQLDVLAPLPVKKFVKKVREKFPRFMSLKIFGVGSLASTCEQHIGLSKEINEDQYCSIKGIISLQIKKKSKALKAPLIFIKEVPEGQLPEIKKLLSDDFYFYHSLPNTFIPTSEDCMPYPVALRKKERKRYRIQKEEFDKFFSWEIINDFDSVVDEFEKLYLRVLEKSKNQFEILNGNFFRCLNKYFMDDIFLIIARDSSGQIRVMELILQEEDRLTPMYLGINYLNDNAKVLYFNTIFRTIEEAEKREKLLVVLGQTSYYPKVLSGALVQQVFLGFHSYNFILQYLVKKIFGKLFPSTQVMENTYKYELKNKIMEKYSNMGYKICN